MRLKQEEGNLKKIGSKRATVAPYLADPTQEEANLKKIRSKCATVAPYSMFYRFLCNALQRASQKAKKIGSKRATSAPYLADHTRECQPRHPQVMRTGQPLIKYHYEGAINMQIPTFQ